MQRMVKSWMCSLAGTILVAFLLVPASVVTARAADGASTPTPDLLTFLVSKDVGVERWVVSLNLSPSDPGVVANVTGNVFKSDGSAPSFVVCRPRPDSQGSLLDRDSTFRFVCDGAGACATTARECAMNDWRRIADDVALPARFFLPDAGLAAAGQTGIAARAALALADLRDWSRRIVAPWLALVAPNAADAQANDRGATLTFDRLSYLVNKDLASERWSIGLNYVPVRTANGGVVNRLAGVTGNVLSADGAPKFVSCTVREDSTGTLDDPSSTFRLSCAGADDCTSVAEECARSGWTPIADDVAISAAFFLPPGGLTATPQSDPDIVVIGRTSDPPSFETTDYTTGASPNAAAAVAASCSGACFVPRIGACDDVRGRLVQADGECRCRVEEVDPQCITCGGGASGQCGGDCAFALGDATARGTCLPESSGSPDCVCYAIGAGSTLALESCGGPLAGQCPDAHCCTDDPSDGCENDGTAPCAGICVAGTCDDAGDSCGSCFPIGTVPTPRPTAEPTPSPEETATPTRTPSPTATARPTATPRATQTAVGPTPQPTATAKPTATPAPTTKPTATPKPTATARPTASPNPTPTKTQQAACNDGILQPGEQCEPGQGQCGSQLCSLITCECYSCSPQTLRLDDGTSSTVTYDLGINVGSFEFTYTGFEANPDRFIVRYQGQQLFDSGCVTYGETTYITLPGGASSEIEVEVQAACDDSGAGSWQYVVACPDTPD